MENCDRSSLSRTRVGTFRGFHQVAVTVPLLLLFGDGTPNVENDLLDTPSLERLAPKQRWTHTARFLLLSGPPQPIRPLATAAFGGFFMDIQPQTK